MHTENIVSNIRYKFYFPGTAMDSATARATAMVDTSEYLKWGLWRIGVWEYLLCLEYLGIPVMPGITGNNWKYLGITGNIWYLLNTWGYRKDHSQ